MPCVWRWLGNLQGGIEVLWASKCGLPPATTTSPSSRPCYDFLRFSFIRSLLERCLSAFVNFHTPRNIPATGAVVGLAILCAPVMSVTKMDFNRSGGKTQLQNVVLFPGPARLNGNVVVGTAGVKAKSETLQTGQLLKGEGWLSVQMDRSPGTPLLWLALLIGPLLGLALHKTHRHRRPEPQPSSPGQRRSPGQADDPDV